MTRHDPSGKRVAHRNLLASAQAESETMPEALPIVRPLGTMVAYGFEKGSVLVDLEVASRIGATVLEILPDWPRLPDPIAMRAIAGDHGFAIHSAHGCWGGRSILARRVDLGSEDLATWRASVDDLKRCLDWLRDAGGTHLVVHPGGLSEELSFSRRRDLLASGLIALADHVQGTGLIVCVENMPAGVHPGSRMADLEAIVSEIDRPEIGLALDTGHANIVSSAEEETLASSRWLRTTHVHDNNGRSDSHEPPGAGTVNWPAWKQALDAIDYRGPIMLECIRILRQSPDAINGTFLNRLRNLIGHEVAG